MTSQLKTFMLMAALSAVLIFMGGALGGQQGIIFALVFALIMNVGNYWYSDKIVLSMYRAQELAPEDAPIVHQIVEELARNAGADEGFGRGTHGVHDATFLVKRRQELEAEGKI